MGYGDTGADWGWWCFVQTTLLRSYTGWPTGDEPPNSPAPCFAPGNLHIFSTRVLEVDYPCRSQRLPSPGSSTSTAGRWRGCRKENTAATLLNLELLTPWWSGAVMGWQGGGMEQSLTAGLGTQQHEYSRPICRRLMLNIMSTVAPSAVDLCSTS